MYEDNEKKIDWMSILKKAGIVFAVILVILGIVALVNSCSKKKVDNKPNNTEYSLESQLDEMEKATISYLTKDNLPTEVNSSKTIRLKILINKNLTSNIVDEEKTTCDPNESYAEVTKLDNNYALKISLTCGKNKANRVVYVGCFEKCNGGICKGSESDTDGVCGETVTPPQEDDNKDNTINENKPSTNNPTNTNKPTTPNTKPTTPPTTNKPTNPGNSNSNNNNTTTTKVIEYEYQKCEKVKDCARGDMNANGECVVYGYETLYDTVIKIPGSTYTAYNKVKASYETKTSTVYFNKSSEAKNTATITYTFVRILSDGRIEYKKTEKVPYCSNRSIKPVNGYCNIPYTAKNPDKYDCKNANLGYKYSNGVCTKQEYKIKEILQPVYKNSMCNTKWSTNPNLAGWTKTGRTRTR